MARASKHKAREASAPATPDEERITASFVSGGDAPIPEPHKPLEFKSMEEGNPPAMETMNPENLAKVQGETAKMQEDLRAKMGFGGHSRLIGGYQGLHRNVTTIA